MLMVFSSLPAVVIVLLGPLNVCRVTAASAGLQTGRLNLNMTGELLGGAAIRLEDGES